MNCRHAEFTLNGVKFAKYARALGLPPEARNWSNIQLLTCVYTYIHAYIHTYTWQAYIYT